jgi:hypothetical protein
MYPAILGIRQCHFIQQPILPGWRYVVSYRFFSRHSSRAGRRPPNSRRSRKHLRPRRRRSPDSGKCIGVLSAIGDSINLQKIGITVFGNELNKVPVDSWQIDNLVVSKISAYLSKNWSVRPISYPKGAFATLEQDHGIFYNRDAELTEIIRRVTSSTKCDHYVVVLKGSSGYGTTNQSLYGLGVLEVGAPIMITDMLFALYVIKVYDGQTFAVLGQQQAILDENHFSSIHGPFRQLYTNFTFPQPGTVPGPAVRDGLRSLVEKSLDVTMPQILRIE